MSLAATSVLVVCLASAPASGDATAAARVEVQHAREARDSGDYATALAHYERALELRPAPALHYNIAACHQRLMEGEPATAQAHRAAAIAAYQRYLETAPEASDRADVESVIATLQAGHEPPPPATAAENGWDTPEPTPEPAPTAAPSEPLAPSEPAPTTAPPRPPVERRTFPHARVRLLALVAWRTPAQADVDDDPNLGGILGVTGFLGRRRRASLGGELQVAGFPGRDDTRHHLFGWHLAMEAGFGATIGQSERFELRGTGLLAIRTQRLTHTGVSPTTCPVERTGVTSVRRGVGAGLRINFTVLLGQPRRHEIGLMLTPMGTVFGEGTNGDDSCAAAPFEELGFDEAEFEFSIAAGYGIRF